MQSAGLAVSRSLQPAGTQRQGPFWRASPNTKKAGHPVDRGKGYAVPAGPGKATKIDEIKDIRDQAEALRLYCKQKGESLVAQNQCAEITLRCERKAGAILVAMPKAKGGQPYQQSTKPTPATIAVVAPPTLAELGLDEHESRRWQSIAKMPEQKFEEHIAEVMSANEELTTAGMLRVAAGKSHVGHNSGDNEWYTPRLH